MNIHNSNKQNFVRLLISKRKKSFNHAFRGLAIVFKTQPNAQIQLICFNIAVWLGLYLRLSTYEWLALIITSGFVIALETVNTAFEVDIDLTSPQYHPYAKDTKDIAAGSVLVASFIALSVACIIFIPKILFLVNIF